MKNVGIFSVSGKMAGTGIQQSPLYSKVTVRALTLIVSGLSFGLGNVTLSLSLIHLWHLQLLC